MLNTQRSAYIAALEPLRFEALLGRADSLSVVGSGSDEAILPDINSLRPDFLLLDGVLSGVDSLNLLRWMRDSMPAPPRVLYLGREEEWIRTALSKGADAAALWDCGDADLARLAQATAQTPLPRLSEPWEADRREISEKLAARLGISNAVKGKNYICQAVSVLACAPQLGASYSGMLYPLIAARCGTSSSAVEKAVRTAIEHTWLHGDLGAIQNLFGYSVDAERGKPTNAEFLSMLAGHVQRALAHRMKDGMEKKPPDEPKK
ncbi:MAG: hypothetical protein IK099_00640 [Clostridia bacterium]|nr:hypothetical protein [Clostridia bacterium]